MKKTLIKYLKFFLMAGALTACNSQISQNLSPTAFSVKTPSDSVVAFVNLTLVDGTGANPLPDAVVVVQGSKILQAGSKTEVAIPADARLIDLKGATVLPGLINAHIHNGFDAEHLKKWAYEGVTTVRDMGVFSSAPISELIQQRNHQFNQPEMARLVSAGHMLTVTGGYGSLYADSVDEAVLKVNAELDGGADLIKISMEDGYAGQNGLPKFSPEQLSAVVKTAHARGKKVSAHITQGKYLKMVVDAGVDNVAHVPYDYVDPAVYQKMIKQGIYMDTTLTVMDAYGASQGAMPNLITFVRMGGIVDMGSDYTQVPQNGYDHFELGMPMHEILRLADAGLTPMQIIVASTQNAAHACQLDSILGTIEPGKEADLLVVNGNPLEDLNNLTRVRMVVHGGVIIRQEP